MSYGQAFPVASPQGPTPTLQRQQAAPDLAVRLRCPDCQDENPSIIEEFGSGDLVCANCGLVLGDRIVDTRSEWRTFANEEGDDPSRVGAAGNPLLDGNDNLETSISFRDGGSGFARELQRAAGKSQSGKAERNLLAAFREISTFADSMSLPKNVSDIAKQFYKRADEEKALRGKNTEAIVACCVFIACRQAKVPRTFKEIGQLSHVPKKQLGTTFRALEQVFNFHHQNGLSAKTSPEDLVPRYCNHLNLPAHVQNFCVDVILNAREHSIANGRSPVSLAGAAVYFTTCLLDKPKQMKEISRVAGVSEGTIKLVYRIMYQEREKLVDPEWITSGRADLSRLPPADAPPAGK